LALPWKSKRHSRSLEAGLLSSSRRLLGNLNAEQRATAGRIANGDPPAMKLHRFSGNGEA
jgi:hypothetical protein